MAAHHEQTRRDASMRHRNAGEGRRGHGTRDARHDIEGNSGDTQRQRLFAATAEHERIAALEAHDAAAAARRADHHGMNRGLRQSVPPRAFADEEFLGPARKLQHAPIDQRVVQNQVRSSQPRHGFAGQQRRIARAGPDERDVAAGHGRESSSR